MQMAKPNSTSIPKIPQNSDKSTSHHGWWIFNPAGLSFKFQIIKQHKTFPALNFGQRLKKEKENREG